MKKLSYFLIVLVFAFSSCKKESKTDGPAITADKLNEYTASAQPVATEIQDFVLNQMVIAIDSGMNITSPPSTSRKSAKAVIHNYYSSKTNKGTKDWSGFPDADGWYTETYTSLGYTITESWKYEDSTVYYKYDVEYHGGDGDYSNVWLTQYTQVHKNHKILYQGDSDWKIHTFGDNDISDLEYDFKFMDWEPATGAGDYDWYWGATSLGGDPVPYHRFLSIVATDIPYSDPPMLHEKITWYDDGGAIELGSWEFDTYAVSVDMPEIPPMNK
jgi:hypothetical protein